MPRRADPTPHVHTLASAPDLALSDVAEALPFGVLITDELGSILQANAEAEALTQVDRRLLIGASVVDLAPERYRRTMRAALESIYGDRASVRWEQEIAPAGHEPLAVEVTAAPVDSAGPPLVLWVLTDIRERVAVERRARALTGAPGAIVRDRTEALETERARLAAVMEQIPAGLVIVDAPDGNVVSINDEALRILRLDGLESGVRWQGWTMDGAAYEADEWPLDRSRLHGEVVTGERAEVLAGDGARIVLDISSAPVTDSGGRRAGAVCIFSDVTVRERRERAERDFVTNAAHELQTPLAALVSAVEVLVGGAKDTPERDLFLDHIARESERLTRLIRALLTLARAEMGADAPTVGVVALRPLLESVARQLNPAPGVAVSVTCPDDLAAVANAELLEQALVNLSENAAKYTAAGNITIDARRRGDTAQISVADTGPGISAADRPRVFERFQRGADGRGSGLGLAIVRSAIEALGGEVELDSQVGVGTTVRLRLPYVTALVTA